MDLHSADKNKINDLVPYELAPVQTALFKAKGEGRCTTSKADLKNGLKVEVSVRNIISDATLING